MTDYAVRVTRLNYTYADGAKALEGIDLDVRIGERVALVGPSGSGKSTLLLHLNGTLPGKGAVRIMGQSLDQADLRQIRSKVGLLFQDPNDQLFCPTVYEDVAFGLLNLGVPQNEISLRVENALRAVGLDRSIRSQPFYHLSLGERKRVSLAAVLAMEPEILALDDPAGSLDLRNRRRLIELIRGLKASLIAATCDLEFALEVCPRTVVMDRGKIWADGETRSILADGVMMEAHGLEVPLSLKSGPGNF